ncbi:MAG: hypothetical protein KBA66_19720 [Leptospiraceae bacterium]|nr:hypothetical protein [Leptospiraceae bacterium]
MYPILVSIDEGLLRLLNLENVDLGFLLKFAIFKEYKAEFCFFQSEKTKNIRLHLEKKDFFILNSICKENNCYINEYAGELITEVFLEIIRR